MKEIIAAINQKVASMTYCELSMRSLSSNALSIVGSEDILYFYDFEIRFLDVHTVVCNTDWKLDTSKELISIIDDTPEALVLNERYRVEIGNTIFRLGSDDELVFYVIADGILFIDETVKLY